MQQVFRRRDRTAAARRAALGATVAAVCAISVVSGCAGIGAPPPKSGIDVAAMDPAVRPQDDMFRHVNGHWLDTTDIPADRSAFGTFDNLRDDTLAKVRAIAEPLAATPAAEGTEARKIGDLYASYLDVDRVESLGIRPLAAEMARIDALGDAETLPALIAHLQRIGVTAPFDSGVHRDNRDSTRYVLDVVQSGLGLPDRDYYLADEPRLVDVRTRYVAHVERMLALAGVAAAGAAARDIVDLETRLARAQWTKVENRDRVKRYNKTRVEALSQVAPGFDWTAWLQAVGVRDRIDDLIVSQPSFLAAFAAMAPTVPSATWKAYFKWHLVSAAAPWLPQAFVDENFAFYGTTIGGTPKNRPRWERAVVAVEGALGDAVGRLYVERYFPPANKARIDALVGNLLAAYRQSIDGLDWMGPATRAAAKAKLAKLTPKIGYPDKWRDYAALRIERDDLVGNMLRSAAVESDRDLARLGRPIDRREWHATPQTVNAYYNPEGNEIVFPAAILQPPFFDAAADDAVNYGSIGAVIGHEISHGFDDQGSRYDGDGNLHDWFTPQDHAAFVAKTARLVDQYAAYAPLPGSHVNGELTLGENIADNAGLAVAYRAYELSLGGKRAPTLDGLSGPQRFYAGFCALWRRKVREATQVRLLKIDPHAPAIYRCNGVLANQPGFYAAYDVREGDGMYLPPELRTAIW